MKFIIIHGAYGDSSNNWFPWLKKELEQRNHEVITPNFPTPDNQTLEQWLDIFKNQKLDQNTILIGHSLGVPFIINLLERTNKKIKAAFLVAGFVGKLNLPKFYKINKSFAERDFDFNKIKNNSENFFIYHSDDDPYIPIEKAEELAVILDAQAAFIPGAGHFNETANYLKFPRLLNDILDLLKEE
jgi:uncharacterized protein